METSQHYSKLSFICMKCRINDAYEFCCCKFPVFLLCNQCQQVHSQKEPDEIHVTMAADYKSNISTEDDLAALRSRLVGLIESKKGLKNVINRISACQEMLQERKAFLLAEIEDYVAKESKSLETLKQTLIDQSEQSFLSARDQVMQSYVRGSDLAALLWRCNLGQVQNLFEFSMLGKEVDVQHLVGVQWESHVQPSGHVSYKASFRLSEELAYAPILIEAEKKHANISNVISFLTNIEILQKNPALKSHLDLLTSNLTLYIREASDSDEPHVNGVMYRLSLIKESDFSDCESLAHLLSQTFRYPAVDLEVLASDLTTYRSSHLLAEIRPHSLCLFNCNTASWQERVFLSPQIQINSLSASTFLPDGHIFICGGKRIEASPEAFDLSMQTGEARKLNSMNVAREAPGLQLYYSFIYVFGGEARTRLRTSEKFSLRSGTWHSLSAPMHSKRAFFTPCLHCHLIYLCGGDTSKVETFSPMTESFEKVAFSLPESKGCRTVVIGKEIVVISLTTISRRLISGGKVHVQRHPELRVWGSINSTIVLPSGIWLTSRSPEGTVYCMNPQTACVERDFAYTLD